MSTFFEGVEAITQACTLALLLPGLAMVLVARRGRLTLAVCYTVFAAVLMWAQAAQHWSFVSRGAIVVVLGVLVAATFVAARSAQRADQRRLIAAGVVGGALAGWMWLPCVGTQLGDILNNATTQGPRTLVLMIVYTIGALLPVLLIALLSHALPASEKFLNHRAVAVVGLGFGALYAITVAIGRYDDLVGELYRISVA
ncbi:MAG: hypothetical protein F4Y27_12080 [Acidimicrobiaceae bacterium]|nr:hypothetical protein [Acidimicrobiaceae bacterium]MXW74681.1 hypothetical protein [Acidimicrobiaceae bacterium]MYA75400.1 hypothetical protein [Acidimicrobiaceae bacterium]MYD05387.1 hypothetical protein [Acidimicrobiaceae bacterium]MYG56797.1 hypothetical protein [Acidimicrobiaceae bacterium]